MKILTTVLCAVMALTLAFASAQAQPTRLGGGKPIGKQSSNVTQKQASGQVAPAVPITAPKKPWVAMLGVLAAGLGLAWLASSLGLSDTFGQMLMFALLALAVMAVGGFLYRKLRKSAGSKLAAGAYALQGAGSATTPRNYNPENVGNDSSARPWERHSMAFEPDYSPSASLNSGANSGLSGLSSWSVPADFDADGFLKACRANFMALQAAWDRSDIHALRAMMTDDMLREIKTQLADRESHTGASANKTDVQMLNAKLLGIEQLSDVYMASVEFSGMIQEHVSAGASPFREIWNMTKPRNGAGGWLVAGVQALQ